MRQVILDTETTGLSFQEGHRVIEIGGIELLHRRLTGRHFHTYLQPDRVVEEGAIRIHGITNEFLKDKPRFQDISQDFKRFIQDCELIIHNAPFDVGFLQNEFQLANDREWIILEKHCKIFDTLVLARQKHPGQRNNLDALCKRYAVNNKHRDKHGALLDAQILAEVYLLMTVGQETLVLDEGQAPSIPSAQDPLKIPTNQNDTLIHTMFIPATAEEIAAHEAFLDILEAKGVNPIWRNE